MPPETSSHVTLMVTGKQERKNVDLDVHKVSELRAAAYNPRTISPEPDRLTHLEVGQIKELADGVFVKKTEKGILELYISQT